MVAVVANLDGRYVVRLGHQTPNLRGRADALEHRGRTVGTPVDEQARLEKATSDRERTCYSGGALGCEGMYFGDREVPMVQTRQRSSWGPTGSGMSTRHGSRVPITLGRNLTQAQVSLKPGSWG